MIPLPISLCMATSSLAESCRSARPACRMKKTVNDEHTVAPPQHACPLPIGVLRYVGVCYVQLCKFRHTGKLPSTNSHHSPMTPCGTVVIGLSCN
jgi:hypothetical protein